MVQGVYSLWINILALVGFGDLWPFEDRAEGAAMKICVGLVWLFLMVGFLGSISRAFSFMSHHFDKSIDKKIVKAFSTPESKL